MVLSQADEERQGRVFQAQGPAKPKRHMSGKNSGGHRKLLAQLVGGVCGRALRARKVWGWVKAWVRRQGVGTGVGAAHPLRHSQRTRQTLFECEK